MAPTWITESSKPYTPGGSAAQKAWHRNSMLCATPYTPALIAASSRRSAEMSAATTRPQVRAN